MWCRWCGRAVKHLRLLPKGDRSHSFGGETGGVPKVVGLGRIPDGSRSLNITLSVGHE